MSTEERLAQNVVTSENRAEFMQQRMDLKKPVEAAPDTENQSAEVLAEDAKEGAAPHQDAPKPEAKAEPKEGDKDGNKVYFKGKWVGKHDFDYRVHVKVQERIADSEKAIAAEKEARAKAEKEAADLKARQDRQPAPPAVNAEPKREDFKTDQEYDDARTDWRVEQKIAERDKATQAQRIAEAHKARTEAIRKEVPDYEERIKPIAAANVSDEFRDLIVSSEVGPEFVLYLAEKPAEIERLGALTVGGLMREFGRIEARLEAAKEGKKAPKDEKKDDAAPQKGEARTTVAEISRAPEPIRPLSGGGAGTGVKIDENGEFTGSPQEWKALRKAGKIK